MTLGIHSRSMHFIPALNAGTDEIPPFGLVFGGDFAQSPDGQFAIGVREVQDGDHPTNFFFNGPMTIPPYGESGVGVVTRDWPVPARINGWLANIFETYRLCGPSTDFELGNGFDFSVVGQTGPYYWVVPNPLQSCVCRATTVIPAGGSATVEVMFSPLNPTGVNITVHSYVGTDSQTPAYASSFLIYANRDCFGKWWFTGEDNTKFG